jgi:hypothetical protein
MFRPPSLHRVLALSVVALAACGESQGPTQPEVAVDPAAPAPLFALVSNTWTLKAPYPGVFGAIGLSAGVLTNAAGQSIVYAIGGTDGEGGAGVPIQTYNVATNVWASKGPEPRVDVFNANGVGSIGGKLYFGGGRDYNNGYDAIVAAAWLYDPVTNTKTQRAGIPKATAEGVTGVIDGKLYVLPGNCSTDNYPNNPFYCVSEPIRTLFRYNPGTNTWTWKRPAPHYHANGAGGVINGKFYVAGGSNNFGSNPEASLDRYDPATDTWTTLAPMPTGGAARGAVLQGKLFVVTSGGAYAYNPATNTWSAKARPRYGHDAIVAITWAGQPYLLALGGVRHVSYPPYTIPNYTEVYKP